MTTIQIEGITYDLSSLEIDCWHRLINGSLSYKNPFHNPIVANTNEYGVNMRTVVLRKADAIGKELSFHTDIRSGKWKELALDNRVSWLFYSPIGKIQIRVSGTAALHHSDNITADAWNKSTMSSRKIYSGEQGPSTISELPISCLLEKFEIADPTPEESEAGRKNFGIVITKVNWMEWLWLNSKGHRRASFTYSDEGKFTASWLVP